MDDTSSTGTGNDWVTDYEDEYEEQFALRKPNRDSRRVRVRNSEAREDRSQARRSSRVESRDGTFRCKQCKTIVGVPISGGRHRNHCPTCLYSRHVDRSRPGDRLEVCRSMMEPIGIQTRLDGEQMLVHQCRGCGAVRRNRVAADDNSVSVMRLPLLVNDENREGAVRTA